MAEVSPRQNVEASSIHRQRHTAAASARCRLTERRRPREEEQWRTPAQLLLMIKVQANCSAVRRSHATGSHFSRWLLRQDDGLALEGKTDMLGSAACFSPPPLNEGGRLGRGWQRKMEEGISRGSCVSSTKGESRFSVRCWVTSCWRVVVVVLFSTFSLPLTVHLSMPVCVSLLSGWMFMTRGSSSIRESRWREVDTNTV